MPPLALASLIRLILSLERPRKLIGAQVVDIVFNKESPVVVSESVQLRFSGVVSDVPDTRSGGN